MDVAGHLCDAGQSEVVGPMPRSRCARSRLTKTDMRIDSDPPLAMVPPPAAGKLTSDPVISTISAPKSERKVSYTSFGSGEVSASSCSTWFHSSVDCS